MSRLDLASLREGDVIERRQTLQVTRVSGEYVEAKDVQSYKHYGFTPADVNGSQSTLKLEMVKRSVRKPKVGDIITGEELYDTRWKRGTAIKSRRNGRIYLLRPNGSWAGSDGFTYYFECIDNGALFEILHVA